MSSIKERLGAAGVIVMLGVGAHTLAVDISAQNEAKARYPDPVPPRQLGEYKELVVGFERKVEEQAGRLVGNLVREGSLAAVQLDKFGDLRGLEKAYAAIEEARALEEARRELAFQLRQERVLPGSGFLPTAALVMGALAVIDLLTTKKKRRGKMEITPQG